MTKQTTNKVTKETVLALINEQDADGVPTERGTRAIERALVALFAEQTADEQHTKSTNHSNGQGFTGVDANFLSDLAQTVLGVGEWTNRETGRSYPRKGPRHLTLGQLKSARKCLQKYGTQLAGIATRKMAAADVAVGEPKEDPYTPSLLPDGSPVILDGTVTPQTAIITADSRGNVVYVLGMACEDYLSDKAAWLKAYEERTYGETGLSTYLEAAVPTAADIMDGMVNDLKSLDAQIKVKEAEVASLKAQMTEIATRLGGLMGTNMTKEDLTRSSGGSKVVLPTAAEIPMADPDLRTEDEEWTLEPDVEVEDDFDRIFGKPEPRAKTTRQETGSVESSVERWAERTYGDRFRGKGSHGSRRGNPSAFEMALKAIPCG